MNIQEILAEVMMIPATELALLQRIAGIHNVPLDPDGDAMKNALVAHLQTLTPTDPANPAAEAEVLAWLAAPAPGAPAPAPTPPPVPPAQTPPPTGLGGNFLTNGGIWQLLVAAAVVAVIVVLAFWAIHELTDDDGESSISASPDATPVVSPTATATSSAGGDSGNPPNGGQPDTDNPQDAHYKRLEELDRVYDPNQDYVAWLTTAGVTWDRLLKKDAREVETEYNPATKHNLAAAIQVEGTGIVVSWPNIVTTHVPSWIVQNEASRSYQPDASDPSVIYTNVVLNGEGTIWIAGYYWADQLGITMTTSSGVVTEVRSIDDFKALGTVHQVLYDGAGRVAGVQITLNVDFAAPQGFVIHRQDAEVPTAKAGEKVSIWMPEALRTSG